MRSVAKLVVAVACLSAVPAYADVSKAWQSAKDNLPARPAIAAIDVAAVTKLAAFGKLLDFAKQEEREIGEALSMFKAACKLDPMNVIDGIVIAGDPDGRDDDIVLVMQLTIDRAKASACAEAVFKQIEKKKPVSVKQDGNYTVINVGRDTAYFAWFGPNVVAFPIEPTSKARLEAIVGKKGLASAPVGAVLGKLDTKAIAFGAISTGKPLDNDLPITAAYGSVTAKGATLSAKLVGTATDAAAAAKLAAMIKQEFESMSKRSRTPAVAKKILGTIAVGAAGAEVTLTGSAKDTDLLDAFTMMIAKKKPDHATPAP